MKVIFDIPTTDSKDRCFLTWVPVKSQLRLEEAATSSATHSVTLQNAGAADGGKVIFGTVRSDPDDMEGTLTVDLPSDGSPVEIWVAGEFKEPSIKYGDAVIRAVDSAGEPVGSRELMVRVRKNAVQLTENERNRFLDALGTLNDAGQGPFKSFRDMHRADSENEEHGFAGFLPWHRAYLLDLERSLQEIDATVALPYWRFDEPAPTLFAPEFFGMPDSSGANSNEIVFPSGHALEFWQTDTSADPIRRRPLYDIAGTPPEEVTLPDGRVVPFVITQAATMRLGGPANEFHEFRGMEVPPHGAAHVSFEGPVNDTDTAPKDPLFFLLHCNVDRLWAFWQWFHKRTKEDEASTYSLVGSQRADGEGNLGARLDDTFWPWNGDTSTPRPGHAPRPSFPASPFIASPGQQPTVRSMIDFHGIHTEAHLGFSYDNVPFELEPEDQIA